jgi:hypothetical protein
MTSSTNHSALNCLRQDPDNRHKTGIQLTGEAILSVIEQAQKNSHNSVNCFWKHHTNKVLLEFIFVYDTLNIFEGAWGGVPHQICFLIFVPEVKKIGALLNTK